RQSGSPGLAWHVGTLRRRNAWICPEVRALPSKNTSSVMMLPGSKSVPFARAGRAVAARCAPLGVEASADVAGDAAAAGSAVAAGTTTAPASTRTSAASSLRASPRGEARRGVLGGGTASEAGDVLVSGRSGMGQGLRVGKDSHRG